MTRPRYILELFRGNGPVYKPSTRIGHEMKRPWYWRLRHRRNRRIVAIGGEAFARKWTARRSFRRLRIAAIEE